MRVSSQTWASHMWLTVKVQSPISRQFLPLELFGWFQLRL